MTLKTGVPGSGKTLTAVDELRALLRGDPGSKGDALRPVFVHGIPDLALPVVPLPVFAPVSSHRGDRVQLRNALEVDWAVVPDGALVVIDEAQHIFPVRGAGAVVPGYVAWLNTHRHRGIDIVLMTQHPRLIDAAVRKLIGKHQHYRRLWGGSRHVCYEWDYCSEALSGMDQASKSVREFPRRAFSAYKSAEIHTKQSFRKPLWLAVPVLAVIGGIAVAPKAYQVLNGAATGKGIGSGSAESSAPGASAVMASASAPGRIPPGGRPGLLALRAPSPVPLPVPVEVPPSAGPGQSWPPLVGGCWIDAVACTCVLQTQPARLVRDLGHMCVQIARGELVVDPSRPRPQGKADDRPVPGLAGPAGAASAPPIERPPLALPLPSGLG